MNNLIPKIAIPEPTSGEHDYNQRSLPQYIHAIESAGGIAVPIELAASRAVQAALAVSCSAILLPGSPADIDPKRYGQDAIAACAGRDELRESADNLLLEDAFADAKPIFGVCFGLQSLNVWLGGTLLQDLPRFPAAVVDHQPGKSVAEAHLIEVARESRMALALLADSRNSTGAEMVNSSHHQAVHHAGIGLRVVARCPQDGVVEAVEGVRPDHFVLGVQWHPERNYEASAVSRSLFAAFLEAARYWTAVRL